MSVADLTDAAAWDERYASTEHPWCCAPAGALTSRIEGLTPGRAIDLGCGVGRHTRFLAESGWDVQAVDFSPVAIEVANTAPNGHHITYTVADARVWAPDEQADLVVMSFLHLPIGELVAVITAAGAWLTPDGHLLYLGHAPEDHTHGVGGPHDPRVLPSITDLAGAARGMLVRELGHLLRPHADTQAIDVLLHAQAWDAHRSGHRGNGRRRPVTKSPPKRGPTTPPVAGSHPIASTNDGRSPLPMCRQPERPAPAHPPFTATSPAKGTT